LEATKQVGFGDGSWVGVARGRRGFGGHRVSCGRLYVASLTVREVAKY